MAKDLSLGIHFHKRLSAMKAFVAEMSDKALTLVRHFDEIEFVEQDAIYSINAVGSWGLDRVDQVNLPLDDTYTPRGDGAVSTFTSSILVFSLPTTTSVDVLLHSMTPSEETAKIVTVTELTVPVLLEVQPTVLPSQLPSMASVF
ncbi:uncharacterized protein [Ptychodera flava]|uniref:uncharacterized protein n=1 Tax=Ptychodera flava TaxID=63121 RepID=UPI003969BD89